MLNNVRYAGISVQETKAGLVLQFHVCHSRNQKFGTVLELPQTITYTFVEVPKGSSKLDAARFLLNHKAFKSDVIKEHLKKEIQRLEEVRRIEVKTKRNGNGNGNGKKHSNGHDRSNVDKMIPHLVSSLAEIREQVQALTENKTAQITQA